MATTVEQAFNQFHDAINLDGDQREIANTRRDKVKELLSKKFEVLDAFSTGSIPRFTALKGHSDVDVMAVLHYGKHIKNKTPAQVLKEVREALGDYKALVRRNGQAVTLYFKTWPNVDIVPVSFSGESIDSITHYNVPNENTGTWIKSQPKTHSRNIEAASTTSGANCRRIIKMIKRWNLDHSDYLQSYHLEVLALKVFAGNLDDTPWHVHRFFENVIPLLEQPLTHGPGTVDEYLSDNDRIEVLKRVKTAYSTSLNAWYAVHADGDHKTAIGLWKQIFGDKFPAYG